MIERRHNNYVRLQERALGATLLARLNEAI